MQTGPSFRPAIVIARERLAAGRAKLRKQHDSGSPGIQVCALLSDLLDSVVLDLYWAAIKEAGDPTVESEIALVPHGGYGRRDVAPYSDVDLMMLTRRDADERVADVARHLTRYICDAGLQLGFSLRTPAQACSIALKDATVFTSLAESRFLAGSIAEFRRFSLRFQHRAQRKWRSLVETILESRWSERRQYGETVYLLEPNVKRSRGGLRDVQMIRWLGFARYGAAGLESLHRTGAISQVDHRRLLGSHEFLLRLRNEMHFFAGKSQDSLTRDEQVRLAELLKYRREAGVLPVELFMRDYFEHSGNVRHISAHFTARIRAPKGLTAVLGPIFSRQLNEDYRVGPVHISATRTGLPKVCGDLGEVLRIMELANLYNKRIDHTTWEAIRDTMAQRPPTEISPEVVNRFLSLLSEPARLADLLRRLHQLRVLEQIIPAMQHARNLVQFNDYHKYTVDEHSIRAVGQATQFQHDPRPIGDAYRELRNKKLLHLALLIHDLGKGYEGDHSDVGAGIAAEVAQRLRLSADESEILKFLVRKHLLMPHIALRQDLHDESVILRLAVEVGSPHVLRLLYLHSCADIAAVGPGVLNDWKLELLTDLYHRTLEHLTGSDVSRTVEEKTRERRQAIREQVGGERWNSWWESQVAGLPASYLLDVEPKRIVSVLERLHGLPPTDVVAWSRYVPERKATIYLVGAHDSICPGVFHKLTGALTAKGLEILSAEIHTLADGLVLDRFFVHDMDYEHEPPPARVQEICDALEAALTVSADKPPAFRQIWTSRSSSSAADFAALPSKVRFDDSSSDRFTIITVFAYDRRGLLYTIARTLFELGLVVHGAKIGTYLDQVVDSFFITDGKGRKIYDDAWLEEIRGKLTDAIDQAS
jgi:[protein-PII] uridylyltransferase